MLEAITLPTEPQPLPQRAEPKASFSQCRELSV